MWDYICAQNWNLILIGIGIGILAVILVAIGDLIGLWEAIDNLDDRIRPHIFALIDRIFPPEASCDITVSETEEVAEEWESAEWNKILANPYDMNL